MPKKRQWGLQNLEVGKDLARLERIVETAVTGQRFPQCGVRAISKEYWPKQGVYAVLSTAMSDML